MGTGSRQRPERLAEKLAQIRTALGFSQGQMLKHLGEEETISQAKISHFETGYREPTLPILLKYARAANVYVDALIDDELDLPELLPSPTRSEGVRRERAARGRRKR